MKTTAKRKRNAAQVDWRRLVWKILPHAAIVIAGMLIVFFVIDRFNKPMGFMVNEFHKVITFALSLLALCLAVRLISLERRTERAAYRRLQREAKKKQPVPAAPKPAAKAAAPADKNRPRNRQQ